MVTSWTAYLRGSVLYFFLFMAYGSISPFMPLIWRSKGLSEHQVGLLGAIYPVCSFFATPMICAFADKHGIQQRVLYGGLLLFTLTRPSVLLAGSFLATVAVEASCSTSASPVGSIVDSAVRRFCGGDGFGAQRLWGAIGFGFASLIAGYVVDSTGGNYEGAMAVFVANMLATLAVSLGVPVVRREARVKDTEESTSVEGLIAGVDGRGEVELPPRAGVVEENGPGQAFTASVDDEGRTDANVELVEDAHDASVKRMTGDASASSLRDGRKGVLSAIVSLLTESADNMSFFAAVVLSGMGAGVIDTFLFIRLEELGGSHLLCGLARLVMCIAEVPIFYLSGTLIRWMGVRGVIALAQAAYLTRFVYYAILQSPWWVLPAEVLHGLTFAAMWAASIDYAHIIAPDWLQTTVMGLVSGLHWGLGFGLGAVLGGVLFKGLGARLCFGVSAVLPSLSLTLLAAPATWRWASGANGHGCMENSYEAVAKDDFKSPGDDNDGQDKGACRSEEGDCHANSSVAADDSDHVINAL